MKKGTKNNPIEISSASDMALLGKEEYNDSYFIFTDNIDFSELKNKVYQYLPDILKKTPPYENFSGVLDGKGHSIKNLNINRKDENWISCLIGSNRGMIRNINIIKFDIQGHQRVGAIVGENHGTIKDCHTLGFVEGDKKVGGMVGINFEDGEIINCTSNSRVKARCSAGGVVGVGKGKITDCFCDGKVHANTDVGGIIGINHGGIVKDSNSSCNVDVNLERVGGIAGKNNSGIKNCYFNGNILHIDIQSNMSYHDIDKVDSRFDLFTAGTLVGRNNEDIRNCYWDSEEIPKKMRGIGEKNGNSSYIGGKRGVSEIKKSIIARKI